MARAYSGVLACVALSLAITRGLVLRMTPNEILAQCIGFFILFAVIGYVIGFIAEKVVRESVESQFRKEMAAAGSKSSATLTESLEQPGKLA